MGNPNKSLNEDDIWVAIQAHEIGKSNSAFGFKDRLASENNWSIKFARMRFKSTSDLCFFCVVADILLLPVWKLIKSGIFTSCSRKTTGKSLPINYPLLLIMVPLEEEKRKPASFMNGMGLHSLPTKESSAKLLRNRFGRRVQSASEKIKTTSLLILAKCWLFQEKKRYRFVYY